MYRYLWDPRYCHQMAAICNCKSFQPFDPTFCNHKGCNTTQQLHLWKQRTCTNNCPNALGQLWLHPSQKVPNLVFFLGYSWCPTRRLALRRFSAWLACWRPPRRLALQLVQSLIQHDPPPPPTSIGPLFLLTANKLYSARGTTTTNLVSKKPFTNQILQHINTWLGQASTGRHQQQRKWHA